MSSVVDAAHERRDMALEALLIVARKVVRGPEGISELGSAVHYVDDIDRIYREENEAEAVDRLAEMLEHEACTYTLHATTPEIAVHLALFQMHGALPSCG